MIRQTRLGIVTAVVLAASGGILLSASPLISEILRGGQLYYFLFKFSALGLILVGLGIFLMLYLRGAISIPAIDDLIVVESDEEKDAARRRELRDEIIIAETINVARSRGSGIGSNLDPASGDGKPSLTSPNSDNSLEANISEAQRTFFVRKSFQEAESRLRLEIAALGRRGNLNLVIGCVTTFIAVVLLAYMVLGISTTFDSIPHLLSHYIPRVTIVTFIEVFSFFFLRLYRTSLLEIRTYQDNLLELTKLRVGVEVGFTSSDSGARVMLAKELLSSKLQLSKGEEKSPPREGVDAAVLAGLAQELAKLATKK